MNQRKKYKYRQGKEGRIYSNGVFKQKLSFDEGNSQELSYFFKINCIKCFAHYIFMEVQSICVLVKSYFLGKTFSFYLLKIQGDLGM